LPKKEFNTTADICKILNLLPDTLRYRLRTGKYPEPQRKAGDKRRFTIDEVREIAKMGGTP
jgi:DNA-binding transcriptional MerR regulator